MGSGAGEWVDSQGDHESAGANELSAIGLLGEVAFARRLARVVNFDPRTIALACGRRDADADEFVGVLLEWVVAESLGDSALQVATIWTRIGCRVHKRRCCVLVGCGIREESRERRGAEADRKSESAVHSGALALIAARTA